MSEWPTNENPAIAVVAPTEYGMFGIWWSRFPAMERRGGYSGPYPTLAAAEKDAKTWGEWFECAVRIEVRDRAPETR